MKTGTIQCPVETQCIASLQFGPQSKNLASVIRGFKIGVTKNARKIDSDFEWQPRFYDHIIRNGKSLEKIQSYIFNNPLQWKDDEYNN